MQAQLTRQAAASDLRLRDQQLPDNLHVRSPDRATTNYPRLDYLRPSAVQLRVAN
jgi:hypothetical protein